LGANWGRLFDFFLVGLGQLGKKFKLIRNFLIIEFSFFLDGKDQAANAIFDFIEEAINATESVLVHSVRGQSRATCALAAYIMRKYNWSLLKSLEFLNSRRPDLEIRATFIH
jgi:hypothetical protein